MMFSDWISRGSSAGALFVGIGEFGDRTGMDELRLVIVPYSV